MEKISIVKQVGAVNCTKINTVLFVYHITVFYKFLQYRNANIGQFDLALALEIE